MEKRFVLKGNLCYSKDLQTLETIPGGYLVCEDGKSLGAFAQLPEQYCNLPVTDYGDCLIMPGLNDLHVHAPQYSFRGLGMDLELLDWLNTHTFPEESKYRELEYAERAYGMFAQDMKRSFNTRACVFATVHVPATLLLMDQLEAAGLATMVGKVNMDRNAPDSLREVNAEQSVQDTIEWLKACEGRYQNTAPILTPRFIPSCTDGLMRRLGEIQRAQRLPLQSHLSENQGEIAWVKELCPQSASYSDAYRQFGLFGGDVPTIMAHCVWMQEDEIALMKQSKVFVAHCPQSNTNLASGIAPVRRFLDEGIPVGLGSDVAGGCHLSLLRAMSDAIQVSKLRWRLVDQALKPLTLEEAFYLGTMGGGAFFGKVGSFAAGYELDALVVDDSAFAAPNALPLADRLARVVYFAEARDLRAKYVRGVSIL